MAFDESQHMDQLKAMYKQAFEDILQAIINRDTKSKAWTRYRMDILRDIQSILVPLDDEAQAWIEKTIAQAYWASGESARASIIAMGLRAPASNPAFAQLHMRAIDVIAQNMSANMRGAHQFVGRKIDDVFRRVALEETGKKLTTGATIQDMKQRVIDSLLDKGLTGFKDKAGREWRLDRYAEMVARTTTREAASQAVVNQCLEFSLDLVQIDEHASPCEECAALEGQIFSISGNHPDYALLTDDVRPPIHPRCRHDLLPFSEEIEKFRASFNQP